jgi:competence protein ComEC
MNVTFMAAALVSLFGKMMKRQYVLALSVPGVNFYAFLAGFELSIVRVTVMTIIALAAGLFGRQYFALLSLLKKGYLMLLYRPTNLSDIGFQLFFLSTFGIIGIKLFLPLQKYFIAEDIGTTLAAQLATFPVLFATFGQYGVLSLLVNAFVLWTIPYLMVFGAVGVVGGLIFVPIGKIFVWLYLPFLLYFESVVSFFGDMDWVWNTEDCRGSCALGII